MEEADAAFVAALIAALEQHLTLHIIRKHALVVPTETFFHKWPLGGHQKFILIAIDGTLLQLQRSSVSVSVAVSCSQNW